MTLKEEIELMAKSPFAWPGGYRLILLRQDNKCLCAQCVEDNLSLILDPDAEPDWCPHSVVIYWEGVSIACAHCNKEIESEYGELEEI